MILESNEIPQLVARHRVLTRQKKAIEAEIAEVRAELKPLVEAHGKYTDASGYAQIIEHKPRVSYNGKAVDNLAIPWIESEDAVMQSCGRMLWAIRIDRDGYTSLKVE